MSLIEPDQTFALGAVIMAIVAFCLWAERRPLGQRLGGPLLLIAIAMVAANLGLIPHAAPVYETVGGLLVPMAIPLLLLRADLRTIFSEAGPMLLAFVIAAAATVVGAFVGVLLVDMGPLEAGVAGAITSSYIGGSLNFVATAEAVGIRDSSIYVASLSADAVGAVIFLLLLMSMPAVGFVRRAMPSRFMDGDGGATVPATAGARLQVAKPFDLGKAATGLAISLVVCAVSLAISELLALESLFILVVTALALLVANLARPVVRQTESDFEIGTLFMYVFFVTIGASANLTEVLGAALPIIAFIVVMVLVHLCLLVIVGRVLRLDLAEVLVASNACILGPAPAAALAASKGWQALVAPGILVGMFGYAIATFIGVSISALLGG